ncbi:hypothetical protein E6C27_scaffold542G00490 [Cucumis melo var. makuwa]|uniref:Retrotransposon gag domain-containing protein n=1 Tax=Cucumis melo var. makuwa TaxID=1194695 RepID=A0A5A7UYP0_CUCMM|nr:hypothetical protein E6C27_scaffold542G00490 [Cucumis melo var. makuwa]
MSYDSLFFLTLRDEAKRWENSLEQGEVTTWEDLIEKFMKEFFLPIEIHECVLMKVFYYGLNDNTQQTTDAVFVGGILRSFYSQIKTTMDFMANNSQEWNDDGFGSEYHPNFSWGGQSHNNQGRQGGLGNNCREAPGHRQRQYDKTTPLNTLATTTSHHYYSILLFVYGSPSS